MVSSNKDVTVYVQFSNDGITWFDWYDTNDSAVTINPNNQNKAVEIIDACKYMRIVIHNKSGAEATVTAILHGVM